MELYINLVLFCYWLTETTKKSKNKITLNKALSQVTLERTKKMDHDKSGSDSEEPVQNSSPFRVDNYLQLIDDDLQFDLVEGALDVYNTKNHTHYKLVETLGNGRYLHSQKSRIGAFFHCAFKASDGEFSIKTFYAKVLLSKEGTMTVDFCQILDGCETGCKSCDLLFDSHSPTRSLQPSLGARCDSNSEEPVQNSSPIRVDNYLEYIDGDVQFNFVACALDVYNMKNHTRYKLVEILGNGRYLHSRVSNIGSFLHCAFKASDGELSKKIFYAEVLLRGEGTMTVDFCQILDGCETGCESCDLLLFDGHSPTRSFQPPLGSRWHETEEGVEDYIGHATDALEYFKKKYGADYEFVRYGHFRGLRESCFVKIHFNFVAKPRAATDKASFKRFFAELSDTSTSSGTSLEVDYCCTLIDGKTRAGCKNCTDEQGMSVEHPLDGSWYGLPENEEYKMVELW